MVLINGDKAEGYGQAEVIKDIEELEEKASILVVVGWPDRRGSEMRTAVMTLKASGASGAVEH